MKINLNEIPAEGRQFHFDQKTGELNESLSDIIGKSPYQIDFVIRPIGNVFEVKGRLQTRIPEVCSKCGWDIQVTIHKEINEILLEEKDSPRKIQTGHTNGSIDYLSNGPSMTTYYGKVFDASEFIHECIALAEPSYPMCEENECQNLEEVQAKKIELDSLFQEADRRMGNPAFDVLKNWKPTNPKN